ncbi:MAG TPA: serine hydrolase domain-containing protein [Phenylobacterium sp.]|nr:serine hydrolase domain-containing protein [Phenylobacterium sp.]
MSRSDKAFGQVSALLDGLVAREALPGASVLVFQDGREALYHAAGLRDREAGEPVGRDTIFRVFSMTKPVTAAAVMVLVDDGVLSLDELVTRHIPEFSDLGVHPGSVGNAPQTMRAGPMTIRHLLTHTAGFSYWFQANSPVAGLYEEVVGAGRFESWRFDPSKGGLSGLARSLARVPLVSPPGARWHYSMALEVAGLVVERVSGQTLDAFMQARLFAPLGMIDTAFAVAPEKASRRASLYGPAPKGGLDLLERGRDSVLLGRVPGLSGGGGLTSTIDDYGRFAEMLRQGGTLDGRRVLSERSVSAMMSNQLRPEQLAELPELAAFGLGGSGDGLGFGLGGAVVLSPSKSGVPAVPGEYSWGGAASTTFWVDRDSGLSVVFMTQVLPPSPEMLWDKLHVAIYG